MKPPQAIAFRQDHGRFHHREVLDDHPGVVTLVPQRLPADVALTPLGAERRVFLARPRQDTDETAAGAGARVHVLPGRQLAVGHVQEVAAAGALTEELPAGTVRAVVRDVAAGGAVVDGYATVRGEREEVEQWFQVGARVLAVAPGEGRCGLSPPRRLLASRAVGAAARDGGGVVREFLAVDRAAAQDVRHQVQEQRGPVAVEEDGPAAAHASVSQGENLFGGETAFLGSEAAGPLAQARERFAGDEQVADAHAPGDWYATAAVGGRPLPVQERFAVHALEERRAARQGAEGAGAQRPLRPVGDRSPAACGGPGRRGRALGPGRLLGCWWPTVRRGTARNAPFGSKQRQVSRQVQGKKQPVVENNPVESL